MFLRFILASIPLLIVFTLVLFPDWSASRLVRGGALAGLRPLMYAGSNLRLRVFAEDGSEDSIRLRAENEIVREENARLHIALGLEAEIRSRLAASRVLSFGREFGKEYSVISAPQGREFSPGQFVVDERGALVGRVLEAVSSGAKVRIASNPEETLDAEIIPGGVRTIARGLGSRTFLLDLVSNSAPVREGDFVVVRIPGVSRPAILGQVVRARRQVNAAFQDIAAVLVARPETLSHAFVVEAP